MGRVRVEWSCEPVRSPLTGWVHRSSASQPDPPPPPRSEHGYLRVTVQCRDHELVFASPQELQHAIDVLAQRNLPRPSALARAAFPDEPWGHANSHWLSRLPAELMPWRVREGLVADLREALMAVRRMLHESG